jgi:hypothetical protein
VELVAVVSRAPLFDERRYEHAEEFFNALQPTGLFANKHSGDFNWIFRGQGDASWSLRPSAFRPNALTIYTLANVELPWTGAHDSAALELQGIVNFAVRADRAGFLLPGDAPGLRDTRRPPNISIDLQHFPPTEYLAMAALAQHYGMPTRLLDWSLRPLVAAYFAAEDCTRNLKRDRLAVWALSVEFVSAVGSVADPGFFIVTAPSATNPNLHAQAGVFTLVQPRSATTAELEPPDLDRLVHDMQRRGVAPVATLDEHDHWPDLWNPVLRKLSLPAKESRVLFRLLGEAGVSAATLMPGLGVAQAIREQRRWQWAPPHDRVG